MTKPGQMVARGLLLVAVLGGLLLWAAWYEPAPIQPTASRYLKINQHGDAVADWSGPWACVLDRETDLLWEVKNDREDIHDGYWTYSWFDGETGHPNAGDCYFEPERCDTLDLVKRANQQALCGITRWRLPSPSELQSLIQNEVQPGQATIAKAFFPYTKKGDYWTSESAQPLTGHYEHLEEGALSVSFLTGGSVVLPYRNAAYVRLVTDEAIPQSQSFSP